MRLKTVLVTGGAGYVGAVLVPKLLEEGYAVRILDWYIFGDTLIPHANLIQIKADLRDSKRVRASLRGVNGVIHLASISNDPSFELDPTLAKTINYDATCYLIDQAKREGVKRFIFASSSSVYGVKKEQAVTEDLPLEPLTDYSTYKALSEEYLLKQKTRDFTPIVLRPATVCGWSPRMRLDLTVNLLTIQALTGSAITVFGGSQKRPNIHISDMARAYALMLKAPGNVVSGQVFNVGCENLTVIAIARMVKRVIGNGRIRIEIKPIQDLRSYHISSKKIERMVGFVPARSVQDAISDIIRAWRSGLLSDALTNSRFYNIRAMKERTTERDV